MLLSGFWPCCKIFSSIFAPVWDLRSARNINGKFLKAWQGVQDGRNCSSTANPPLIPMNVQGHFLEGMSWQDGGQLRVPQPGTLVGCWQQTRLWSRLGLPRLPGANSTHLTTLIFLLKAEERIVSTIIPQCYIFQLYLELDTPVTLPAIASTPAPAVMNLKSLAPQTVGTAGAPPALPCRELGAEMCQQISSDGPKLVPRGVALSSQHFTLNPAHSHIPSSHFGSLNPARLPLPPRAASIPLQLLPPAP